MAFYQFIQILFVFNFMKTESLFCIDSSNHFKNSLRHLESVEKPFKGVYLRCVVCLVIAQEFHEIFEKNYFGNAANEDIEIMFNRLLNDLCKSGFENDYIKGNIPFRKLYFHNKSIE